ncbi:MAG: acyltransferase family protein [Acidobacteria bacterium]|nr:acyltransferase family protein [Acidobacteriota bacterium]
MERHYGLDWLRIGAFVLLIFYHIGMFFVPWDWHVKTVDPLDWVAVPMLATNSWRIPLLFVVSGYATRALLMKARGQGAFARDRTARLLIPTIVAMALIIPPQPWVELMVKHGYAESFPHFFARDYFRFGKIGGIDVPTWQHLWFVVYLWVYTMVLALAAALMGKADRLADRADRLLRGPGLYIVPLAWLGLGGFVLFPRVAITHGLFDDPAAHWVYLPQFLSGFLLAGAPGVWATIRATWHWALVAAVLGYLVVAAIEIAYPGNTLIPDQWRPLFTAARIVQGWCAVIALIGIADRFWNRDHPWRATLTEAVFPFYIIHQTIIVVLGWWLLRFGLHPAIEFALIFLATIGGCWLFYDVGRRIGLLRPLIGLRGKPKLAQAPPRP